MMNPQYLPPGQNNNAPNNPLGFPPTSQDYNGVQNANIYNQMPPNGPQMPMKQFDQTDMSQKMQNMNLNGPQGIPSSQLPPGQYPPGANFPPTSMAPGQLPPGMRPPDSMAGRPPVSGASQFQPQMHPPSSTPGPLPTSQPQGFNQMLGQDQNRQFQGPPTSMSMPQGPPTSMSMPQGPPTSMSMPQGPPNSMSMPQTQQKPIATQPIPPSGQPTQMPQIPPHSQSALPLQSGMMARPLDPPGQSKLPLLRGGFQPGITQAGQPGLPPQGLGQPGLPPPSSQAGPGITTQQNIQQPQMSQPNISPQGPPSFPGQPRPPMPGSLPGQAGPPQMGPGQIPHSQAGIPMQQVPSSQSQFPAMAGLPHMPPPLSQQRQQPGSFPTAGPPGQYGMPPMPGQQPMQSQQPMPGQTPMPGQQMPGHPPMPGQPPMSGQQMPGQPPMPGHPPMPGQQMLGHPPMPGQQMPGHPQMPGQPPMPGQLPMPGQPPMPGQNQGYQQPGYPPFPAQQPSYPGQQFPQPQQRRLDPDQMPSPIQVMAEDQQNRGGVFVTNEKGLVPPLVTTDFIVDDKGNSSPRYVRSSMYSVPVTADLLKQTSMPFCLVISPMAETVGPEQEPPLLDFAALTGSPNMGPVRCSRCKAYICPNMKFVDAGRHFKCAFCKATTEVPMEYTQYINSMQQYGRVPAEMALGTYEIVATKEYCRNNKLPNPPAVVFVIDVSYNAIKNGLVQTVCDNIMDFIEAMPKDEQTGKSWTRVGFITYSSTVHFYNIKGTLAQPQMLSVGDVADVFVPLLEGFLALPEESGPVLQALLQQLPQIFRDNKETETVLLPAVQAGLEALKAADTSGQLLVFHTTLPSYNAPGKLINREDRKLLGTDKEKQILSPQTTAYNELGQSCSGAGVCVDMFVCNNAYVDAATIGQLPRLTGGQLHKYTYFNAETDGARLAWDVRRAVSRPLAHDAVMRVRTSTGVRATDFFGHFFMSNTTDVELAAIDSDKAIGVEIKHDDKLTGEDGVYIQAALLYTRRCGQRRLRVINLALNVAHQLADVYRSAELDTMIAFLTKQGVWALRDATPRQVREGLSARCARSLAAYRRHCASPSSAGQLVLPESMKLLPLYTSCMLRSDAIAGGPDVTCDERSCAMYRALCADVAQSLAYTYPRLLPLLALQAGESAPTPAPLRASIDKMNDHGVYLLENGVHILIWVGSLAPGDFVRDVFGVTSPQQIDAQVCELPEIDTPASRAVRSLVDQVRLKRRSAMRLTVMRQHDKLEAVLRHFLVEDRGVDGSSSYVDYLCHIHKEIRALL